MPCSFGVLEERGVALYWLGAKVGYVQLVQMYHKKNAKTVNLIKIYHIYIYIYHLLDLFMHPQDKCTTITSTGTWRACSSAGYIGCMCVAS